MNYYQQEFIQNLKRYRRQEHLSQARLSELCNVSTGTIGNIECGSSKPSFDLILTIAAVLKVHPAMLFSGRALAEVPAECTAAEADKQLLREFYSRLQFRFKNEP